MRRSAHKHRGYVLGQMLIIVGLALLLLALLGKLLVDSIYLQRIAAEHAQRVSTVDSLTRQLRSDALGTMAYMCDATGITLDMGDAAGHSRVRYAIEPETVRRVTSAGDERVWSARRLGFAWRIEPGPYGDVLYVEFRAQPPPRASDVLTRSYSTAIGLPCAAAAARVDWGAE
jgi:hypothetical protein